MLSFILILCASLKPLVGNYHGPPCPDGYRNGRSNICLRVFPEKKKWNNTVEFCQSQDAEAVHLLTDEQAIHLTIFILKVTSKWQGKCEDEESNTVDFWTAGRRDDSSGMFEWHLSKGNLPYEELQNPIWVHRYPGNCINKTCLAYEVNHKGTYGLKDESCKEKKCIICQVKAKGVF